MIMNDVNQMNYLLKLINYFKQINYLLKYGFILSKWSICKKMCAVILSKCTIGSNLQLFQAC